MFIYFGCAWCLYVCEYAHVEVREQVLELVHYFHIEGARNWTRVLKFGSKHLYHLSHLASLYISDLYKKTSDTQIKEYCLLVSTPQYLVSWDISFID